MRINPTGQNIIHQIGQTQRNQQTTSAQIASGNRLQSSAVDAAGMAIANRLFAQFRGFNQADRNVQDGMSMMQTADGALSSIGDMAHRINELTVQAANGILTEGQRSMIQSEISHLTDEIGQIANRTEFNRQRILDGSLSAENGGAWIQSGPNAHQGMRVSIGDMTNVAAMLEDIVVIGTDDEPVVTSGVMMPNADGVPEEVWAPGTGGNAISQLIGTAQNALDMVSTERARLGATINRMEHTTSAIRQSSENIAASHSRIADTDMARASMRNVQNNLLQQSSIHMLRNLMQNEQMMQGMLLRSVGL